MADTVFSGIAFYTFTLQMKTASVRRRLQNRKDDQRPLSEMKSSTF